MMSFAFRWRNRASPGPSTFFFFFATPALAGKEMAASEDEASSSMAMDLFDEFWFFRNPFNPPPITIRQIESSAETGRRTAVRLRKAPSLPSTVVRRQKPPKMPLRHTRSNLESVLRSTPIFPQSDRVLESIVKYVRSHHEAITAENFGWTSASEIEAKETQGFRDLGFVFEKEAVNPRNSGACSPLKGGRRGREEERASSLPSMDWLGGSSPADRKLHLRLWAQVVACSLRQEC